MLSTPTFYCLWVGFCLGTTAGLMTISQLVPFARNAGMTATVATLAITVGAFGNAGGRILSGWINAESKQRIDVRPTHWRDWGVKD